MCGDYIPLALSGQVEGVPKTRWADRPGHEKFFGIRLQDVSKTRRKSHGHGVQTLTGAYTRGLGARNAMPRFNAASGLGLMLDNEHYVEH